MVNKKNGGSKKGGGDKPPTAPLSPVDSASSGTPSGEESPKNQQQASGDVSEATIVRLTRALVCWTALLVVATAALGVAAIFQWYELRSTDNNIAKQVETAEKEYVANNRAWMGPSDASLKTIPKANEDNEITVTYLNYGREPAVDFVPTLIPFTLPIDINSQSAFDQKVRKIDGECFTKSPGAGQIIYPSLNGSPHTIKTKITKENFTQGVVDGKEILFISGCFIYNTVSEVRHSTFCFYYRSPFIEIAHLGVCDYGEYIN